MFMNPQIKYDIKHISQGLIDLDNSSKNIIPEIQEENLNTNSNDLC